MNFDIISQVVIMIFGPLAILLVGAKTQKIRRCGYVVGVASQPFWFYTLIFNSQYYILIAAVFYTISWVNGLKNHWRY